MIRCSYKYGPPTWHMLVKAVDSPAGGNNRALALTISHNHAVSGKGREYSITITVLNVPRVSACMIVQILD